MAIIAPNTLGQEDGYACQSHAPVYVGGAALQAGQYARGEDCLPGRDAARYSQTQGDGQVTSRSEATPVQAQAGGTKSCGNPSGIHAVSRNRRCRADRPG